MAATKVTLTLPSELLAVVDLFVAEHPGATRSGVCAEALLSWLQGKQEAELEEYYSSMFAEERAEESDWASLAAHGAARLWP
jgi:metal-responsive CopG/Arc/MetJ family transcriptional regulator